MIALEDPQRLLEIIGAAGTIQRERLPVGTIGRVVGFGKLLRNLAEELRGAAIFPAIQRFARQAIQRVCRIIVRPWRPRTRLEQLVGLPSGKDPDQPEWSNANIKLWVLRKFS